jgi:hypothetical protein
MKKIFTLFLILFCSQAFSQDSLRYFNKSRNQITQTGMTVLGSWGLANVGIGAAGWANSKGGANKYFYQMDVIWGGTNLGLAILGYTNARKNKDKALNASETLKEQKKLEQIFLINGGLDLVYIGTGIYLKHRGDTHNSGQLKGYGPSIILQGAFLLLFDGTMYTSERNNGNKLRHFLEKNPVTFDGRHIGIIYHLD